MTARRPSFTAFDMPAIRRSYSPLHGPLVPICLRPEPTRAEMLRKANRPLPEQVHGLALIDTGAKLSCVDVAVGKNLFQQVGVCQTYTPSTGDDEPHMAEIFFGNFSFPGIKMPEREQELLGMKLGYEVDGRKVLMLLGRDFLDGCTLTYDGPQQMFELRW